jgi:hypothetical protein
MTPDRLLAALVLPSQARVDQRVPKKHLLEHGAPTAADKRLISEGIEELVWVAALKSNTIGVPAFRDEAREYLEIAVLTLTLRPAARATRLRELVHRAIPYPVVLVAATEAGITLSLAHLRNAENEAGKMVLDGDIALADVKADTHLVAFLESLSLAGLPKDDLFVLYQGWLDRLTALDAARLTGTFTVGRNREAEAARRQTIREIARLETEISTRRGLATKEAQLNRRVELNLDIRRLGEERARLTRTLGEGPAP